VIALLILKLTCRQGQSSRSTLNLQFFLPAFLNSITITSLVALMQVKFYSGIQEPGLFSLSNIPSHNPVLKSPLSGQGHTHPVFSLSLVGSANANQLISASTDGLVCSWQLDRLAQPLVFLLSSHIMFIRRSSN
jgi:hypothetical protein